MKALLFAVLLSGLLALLAGFENDDAEDASAGPDTRAERGDVSEVLLRAKGRWASDIGAIYARLTRRALLAASRLMQKATARDLEEIFPDFVQPA